MNVLFKIYRILFSPVLHTFSALTGLSGISGCRFEPTCSCYGEVAIQKFGLIKGGLKTAHRISRCHPFSGGGGYDPV